MNKKTRKLFTWCLVVSMILTQMLFTNVAFAANRNSGTDRYQTAIRISQNFASADAVVIARGDDFADALCAAPLAYAKGATLLLTETNTLTDGVLAEIQRLKAKTVYIVGGTGAVSAAVETAVKNAGFTVTRISGNDRFETSVKIAEAVGTATDVALANASAFADALSISPIAAFKGMPILLTNANEVPAVVKTYIGSKKVTAVGGSSQLSDAVVSSLGATRLAGADRYSTNVEVLKAFSDLSFANVYVATGEDFADALAGSVLAAETKSPLVLAGASLSDAQSAFLKGKMTKDSKVGVFGGANAVSDSVASAVEGVLSAPATGGPVSVSSVKASAADTMQVTFSAVPADTSKVKFTVKRETTPSTVTVSWNGSVASLKYSSKFPQGNYTVNVMNDTTDLGTSNVTIDQEKVAKIEITTDKFAVDTTGATGYFTYKVTNQYGEDVTNKNLASINWTVPGSTYTENSEARGVIQASTDSLNYLNLSSISITGVDTSANVVVTKTLSVSAAVGTISNIKLIELTNVNNKALQAGNAGEKWNITYEAADMAGNKTTNFTLLKGGMVDQNSGDAISADEIKLSTSGYITAKMVNKSGVGVIELTIDETAVAQLTSDVPVTVTAITKNGTTSTLNLTLKKKLMPATFTIMAPAEDVAYTDAKEVPFVCYDADGNPITKFDDILTGTPIDGDANKYTATIGNSVSLSPAYVNGGSGLYFVKKADGNAKLMYKAPASGAQDQTVILTTTTNTGKFSSITINVRKLAIANTFTVNTDSMVTRLAQGAVVRFDKSFFTAKDQYGRAMTLSMDNYDGSGVTTTPGSLYVKAEATSNSDANGNPLITVTSPKLKEIDLSNAGSNNAFAYTSLDSKIYITALAGVNGTATVKYSLIQDKNNNGIITSDEIIATKLVDYTVVKLSDIKGIKMASGADGALVYNAYDLYDSALGENSPAIFNKAYIVRSKVFGLDANGNQVVLPKDQMELPTTVISRSNDALTTCQVYDRDTNNTVQADDYNKIEVMAVKTDVDDTSVTVSVSTLLATNVRSTSYTVKLDEAQAIATGITAPDEISKAKYPSNAVLADVVKINDQYGKNMFDRRDKTVTVYSGSTVMADGWGKTRASLADLASGTVLTIVDNAGHTAYVTITD